MPVDVQQLFQMNQAQLDTLFINSEVGSIPNGPANGTVIIAPGTSFSPEIAQAINVFAWQGKNFDAKNGRLINRISVFGVNAIIAEVYKAASWMDHKDCIVLDYSKTSFVAHWIRDEIRLVQPNLYLGKTYWDKQRLLDFALEFE